MKLYNTRTRNIDNFTPLHQPKVTFYSCGPTVYDYAHIGHARKYVHDDLLKRSLNFLGYEVTHVMNITDVGHLESDDDAGEDKLEKGARKHGKTPEDVAEYFTQQFFESMKHVHIQEPDIVPKATEHIDQMIELIQALDRREAIYETDEAVYFDVTAYDGYGQLSGQSLQEKQTARADVYKDPQKRHPADFVLWFKRVGQHKNHIMHWDSPWGDGFPGWHIECSTMSMLYLGHTIDIHSGGIDHIPVHHENEIAQSEVATRKLFVKHWFHSEFLKVDGSKMSKSLGNIYTVNDIIEKGIDPLALRFLFLQAHYRQELNFTWESLMGAEKALGKMRSAVVQLRTQTQRQQISEEKLKLVHEMTKKFYDAIQNDLQIPQALAIVWEIIKSNVPSEDKLDLIYSFDRILGLDLANYTEESEQDIPKEIIELAKQRQEARKSKNFDLSDELRDKIHVNGYEIMDEGEGYRIKKR